MVLRRLTTSFRRKWQQAQDLEPTLKQTSRDFPWPYSCSESYRLVPTSEWSTGNWWWNCRSTHPVLEHAHASAHQCSWHWLLGMQPDVLKDNSWDRKHTRLLAEPDHPMEVPDHAEGSDAHRPLLSRSLPLHQSLRAEHRYWRRRRNSSLLERVPLNQPRSSLLPAIIDHPVKSWPQMKPTIMTIPSYKSQ